MQLHTLLTGAFLSFCLSAIAEKQKAPVVIGNQDVTFVAHLNPSHKPGLQGAFRTMGGPGGTGILFQITLSDFPPNLQFFNYHIHEKPISADGNCKSAGGHLNPYKRPDQPPCNTTEPETCQVGDVSGKHGPIWVPKGQFFLAQYVDHFLSNVPDTPAFFGNLSVVVHDPDNNRISCANFTQV